MPNDVVRCAFCRRRAWRLGICKRHKNKEIYWRFFRVPFVITDEHVYSAEEANKAENWTTVDNAGSIEVMK